MLNQWLTESVGREISQRSTTRPRQVATRRTGISREALERMPGSSVRIINVVRRRTKRGDADVEQEEQGRVQRRRRSRNHPDLDQVHGPDKDLQVELSLRVILLIDCCP